MIEKKELVNNKLFLNFFLILLTIVIIVVIINLSLVIGLKNNNLSRLFKGSDFQLFTNGSNLILSGSKDKLYDVEFYKKMLINFSLLGYFFKFFIIYFIILLFGFYINLYFQTISKNKIFNIISFNVISAIFLFNFKWTSNKASAK